MKADTPGGLRRDYPEMTLELDTELVRQEIRWNLEISCRLKVQNNRAAVIIPAKNCYTVAVSPTKIDEFGNPRWFTYNVSKNSLTGEVRRSHVINATVKVIGNQSDNPKEIYSETMVKKDIREVLKKTIRGCREMGIDLCFVDEPLTDDDA